MTESNSLPVPNKNQDIKNKKTLSIVISAYNEEENIDALYDSLAEVVPALPVSKTEIIFVDDGSTDGTVQKINALQLKDKNVKLLSLQHNFGHEIAMTAGMDKAVGDAVIFMDADLQHPPVYIAEMVKRWKNGAEIVLTKRTENEATSKTYKIISGLFYKILNFLSDTNIPPQMPDFRLLDKKYVDFLKNFREGNRLFRGLLNYIMPQNRVDIIEFTAPKRFAGKSKYSLKKSFELAVDSIMQFSVKPLHLSIYLGGGGAFISILLGIYFFCEYFYLKNPTPGFATLTTIIVFLGAVQLIVLGIIGGYIGKIHMEVKKRPLYMAEYIDPEQTEKKENA